MTNKTLQKNILVTGNLGYIGPILVLRLKSLGFRVRGLDSGLYLSHSLQPIFQPDEQIIKDIRDIDVNDIKDVDGIIHLAGLSNDPLGALTPSLTEEINFDATISLAEQAKSVGIKRFVFASSQSIYGAAPDGAIIDEDSLSNINPLTAYADTKWRAEQKLSTMLDNAFCPVFLRPATVFGMAPNLRVDIVFNSFIGSALTTGNVEIKSDGSPWRPVIHVWDVCTAFILGLISHPEVVAGQAFNVGIKDGNFTVRQIAEAAQRLLPSTTIIYTGEHGRDQRSYQVDFGKIYSTFGSHFKPIFTLESGGASMITALKQIQFNEVDFRGPRCNRLVCINQLLNERLIGNDLRFK